MRLFYCHGEKPAPKPDPKRKSECHSARDRSATKGRKKETKKGGGDESEKHTHRSGRSTDSGEEEAEEVKRTKTKAASKKACRCAGLRRKSERATGTNSEKCRSNWRRCYKDEEAREPCHTASERDGRVFPMPGAAAESGEWSGETAQSNKVTKPTTSEVLRA